MSLEFGIRVKNNPSKVASYSVRRALYIHKTPHTRRTQNPEMFKVFEQKSKDKVSVYVCTYARFRWGETDPQQKLSSGWRMRADPFP